MEKHTFSTLNDDGTQGVELKARMGANTWSWPESGYIENFAGDEFSGKCMYGWDARDFCYNYVMLDFAGQENVPRFNGFWDVESANNLWEGNNMNRYAVSLYCRAA